MGFLNWDVKKSLESFVGILGASKRISNFAECRNRCQRFLMQIVIVCSLALNSNLSATLYKRILHRNIVFLLTLQDWAISQSAPT